MMGGMKWLVIAVVALVLGGAALVLANSDDGDRPDKPRAITFEGIQVRDFELESRLVPDEDLKGRVLIPREGGEGRPLLVLLHGRGAGPQQFVTEEMARALREAGPSAPIVLLPDGGDASYWHDRRDGRWGSMVMQEAIPTAARRFGADRERVAIGGISMGGFGALNLAIDRPRRFCAVGAHSPALFADNASTPPGAFDGLFDFSRNDVVKKALEGRKPRAPIWMDSGNEDPFLPQIRRVAAAFDVRLRVWEGEHEASYWRAHYGDYMRFYAAALRRCAR